MNNNYTNLVYMNKKKEAQIIYIFKQMYVVLVWDYHIDPLMTIS